MSGSKPVDFSTYLIEVAPDCSHSTFTPTRPIKERPSSAAMFLLETGSHAQITKKQGTLISLCKFFHCHARKKRGKSTNLAKCRKRAVHTYYAHGNHTRPYTSSDQTPSGAPQEKRRENGGLSAERKRSLNKRGKMSRVHQRGNHGEVKNLPSRKCFLSSTGKLHRTTFPRRRPLPASLRVCPHRMPTCIFFFRCPSGKDE